MGRRNFVDWPEFLTACGLETGVASDAGKKLADSGKRVSDAPSIDVATLEALNLPATLICRAIEAYLPRFLYVQQVRDTTHSFSC